MTEKQFYTSICYHVLIKLYLFHCKMPCHARHDMIRMPYKEYYVYILTNYSKTVLYTGVTNDIERRVCEHKQRLDPKSFTAKFKVDRLMWFETHNNIEEALKREKLIKKWKRQWKFELIEKENPEWNDLSIEWND